MRKHVFFAMAGFFGLALSLSAQETPGLREDEAVRLTLSRAGSEGGIEAASAEGQARLFSTLNSAWYGPARLTLADGRLFSFPGAFAWMEADPADFIPAMPSLAEPPRVTPAAAPARSSAGRPADLLPKFDYASSEVGVFYGKSTGSYGREVKAGYILSEIVEGNTHISVGMSYQEVSGRTPRLGR